MQSAVPSSVSNIDVITYAGEINVNGYEQVCQVLQNKKAAKCLLILATPGGDPHAGFRIARALQHTFGGFDALVPRYCKSAGTLILIGATTLFLDDRSELGPLDVQVKKGDELVGRNSGLDIFQAMNFLQNQTISTFNQYLHELARAGLSTRIGSEIATKLTTGLLKPIAAQIDPIKLAEMQRATEIAFEYGNRLNETSDMMQGTGIQKLVTGYPSHGFVIDRKEARTIFRRVEKPQGFLDQLSKAIGAQMEPAIGSGSPVVAIYNIPSTAQETPNENAPDAPYGSGGPSSGEQAVDGNSSADGTAEPAPTAGAYAANSESGPDAISTDQVA